MIQEYIWFTYVFYWKFLHINYFTPISAISHLFFTSFSKIFFLFIIRLLKCYKNIYGLHRFSIRNSSKLAFSHFFHDFHTFFHTFYNFFFTLYVPLIHTHLLKKIMLIATIVLKFCLGTNFVTYTIHTYTIHTDIWITIPRVGLKALELKNQRYAWEKPSGDSKLLVS